jgi:rubrerythrin
LLELYKARFGGHVPLIRRQDFRGFVERKPVWLIRPLGLKSVQKTAETMEVETRRFYEAAGQRTTDTGIRQLLGDLAEEERNHAHPTEKIAHTKMSDDEASQAKRLFVLQVVQPGLAGLIDGSVSTLAPLFCAAFVTHTSRATFLVGMVASVGAGIRMGFTEALSDGGSLTGRGHPWARGFVCGTLTTLAAFGINCRI